MNFYQPLFSPLDKAIDNSLTIGETHKKQDIAIRSIIDAKILS